MIATTDDVSAELLIQHCTLVEVLDFVNAREDVRAMISAPVPVDDPSPESTADTVPLPTCTTAPPGRARNTVRMEGR